MNSFAGQPFGFALAVVLVALLLVLAVRLADETGRRPRNHVAIGGGAMMAFSLVVRLVDVLRHAETVRWSAVLGAIGVLCFIAVDRTRDTRGSGPYAGPERRKWRGRTLNERDAP